MSKNAIELQTILVFGRLSYIKDVKNAIELQTRGVELHTVVSYKPREILYVAHTMFDFAGCSSPLDLDLACSSHPTRRCIVIPWSDIRT